MRLRFSLALLFIRSCPVTVIVITTTLLSLSRPLVDNVLPPPWENLKLML